MYLTDPNFSKSNFTPYCEHILPKYYMVTNVRYKKQKRSFYIKSKQALSIFHRNSVTLQKRIHLTRITLCRKKLLFSTSVRRPHS